MLQSACELFLGKSEREIKSVAQETLEGHQRAIMGNMTVEVKFPRLKDIRVQGAYLCTVSYPYQIAMFELLGPEQERVV